MCLSDSAASRLFVFYRCVPGCSWMWADWCGGCGYSGNCCLWRNGKKEASTRLATLVALMFLKETMGVVLFSVPSREPREVLHPWPLLMNVVAVWKRDKKDLNGAVLSLSQTFLTHDRTVFVLGYILIRLISCSFKHKLPSIKRGLDPFGFLKAVKQSTTNVRQERSNITSRVL